MDEKTVCCDIEQHAVLFGLLSREVLTRCPDRGEEVIRACVRTYGRQRGGRMAQRCLAKGDALSPENYQAYNERSSKPGQMRSVPAQKEPEYVIHVEKCAWVDAWRKHGLLEYGKYYCLDVDRSLTRGFCEDYEVDIRGLMSWGDAYCDMHWGFPMTEETERAIAEKRAGLTDGAIRSYDFHTGDMFSIMVSELCRLLGEEGRQAAVSALKAFQETFGKEYIRAFADAYPLSEEAMSVVDAVTGQ